MSVCILRSVLIVALLAVPACHHTTQQCCAPPVTGVARFPPGTLPAHPLTPGDAAPMPPGPPADAIPGAAPRPAPVPAPAPGANPLVPPSGSAPISSALSPATAPGVVPEQPRPEVRLSPPPTAEPPRDESRRPTVAEDRAILPPMPVGIPQFAIARDGVASGLKPSLDGLDWLKAKGYRTVVHVRQPMEDDTADRQVIEARGLRYVSITTSPETLSRTIVQEFSRTVDDRTMQPLFVYDRDGTLAGSLWYLYFRIAQHESDDVARLRATRLGLGEEASNANRALWLAIQRLLGETSR